jgi:transcriptional regulator with XRE-family HTH domain
MVGRAADDAEDHRDFGRGLRLLRLRAGLTQEQLSGLVDITPVYLSRIENGHQGVRWHTVMRLLRALDASLGELEVAIAEGQGRSATEAPR